MALIETGQKAPAFSLKDQSGTLRHLTDYRGAPLILYFYPKDNTPGCTTESCDFRDKLSKFKSIKTTVLGISILDEASKAKFAEQFNLNFPLLADENHDVAEKYGVWQEKSMYGKAFMGIARTTYLIDADGNVARRWDKVKVDGHVDEVLAAVKGSLR